MLLEYKLLKSILKGLLTYIPGYLYFLTRRRSKRVNSCSNPSFCYSLWNSILLMTGKEDRSIIAELGPAGSLGLGICAVLTGTKEYHVIDIESNYILDRNVLLFDKIVEMFRNKDNCRQWNSINLPYQNIYSERALTKINDKIFVESVKKDMIKCLSKQKAKYFFLNNWESVKENYYNIVFSRAVMEHVNAPAIIYKNISRVLKTNGLMLHDIELHSHNLTSQIDGHYLINDSIWKIIVGKRSYLLNRLTGSEHSELIKSDFEIIDYVCRKKNKKEFGCYIIAKKKR